MPKRATLTYSSEDAPLPSERQLFIYYCKYSGRHVFTTDCDIDKLPVRKADGSHVLDKEQHVVRHITTDGGIRLIKRLNGKLERQHRLNCGKLPVAYTSDPAGRYLYILPDAVTAYTEDKLTSGVQLLMPPCIVRNGTGATEVQLQIEDKVQRAALIKISADAVRLHITSNISHEAGTQEVLQFLARILGTRLTQMSLSRGKSNRRYSLIIQERDPEQIYAKLRGHLQKMAAVAEARAV